ncbi:MAG: glycoside hydrolase family 2 TIM barrel-domain containing protein [Verrucomicrobiae bacterium]|nr:glycoside hydrolase family 2 TIM barrel-domain containing protein [Verrucomicrobiae bacterium]
MIRTDWFLTHIPAQDFGGVGAVLSPGRDWRSTPVPGNIQTSPFGLPPEELYVLDHVEKVRWMQTEFWVYRTEFDVRDLADHQEAVYCFEGIDYSSEILLDGRSVLRHEGMFSRVEIPLTAGKHVLHVILEPHPDETNRGLEAPDTLKAPYSVGNGWDFAPRLQSRGLWDEAGLIHRNKIRIADAWISTRLRNQQRADVTVSVEFSHKVTFGTLEVRLAGVSRSVAVVDSPRACLLLHVPFPEMWWPNGMGPAHLETLEAVLFEEQKPVCEWSGKVGLREIDRIACEGQAPGDIPLQLTVNGRRVFLKGVNWVPLDACPGTSRESRYRLFLEHFREAGVNFIRVWGGGLREHEAFYRLASEFGLMVMQEFPMACQKISRSEKFLRLLHAEATAIVRRLRGHTSVVLWSGGNEHYHYWDLCNSGTEVMKSVLPWLGETFQIPHPERGWRAGADRYDEPALALMGSVTAREDSSRPYQITSAMEGEGEVHGPWSWNPAIGDHRYRDFRTHYEFWLQAREHLYSECSVSSIANLETIRDVFGTRTPPFPDPGHPIWKMHHAFHAAWDSLPDLWLDLPSTEKLFGRIDDLETLVLANQWMQGEGGRFLVEELRRKMGRVSGVVWWGVNEPWPGLAGNALIDYYGRPKLGWRMIAHSFRPTIVSLRYEHCVCRQVRPEVWVTHEGTAPFEGSCHVAIRRVGEEIPFIRHEFAVSVSGERSQLVRRIEPISLPSGTRLHVAVRLIHNAHEVHRNDYLFASAEDALPFDAAMRDVIRKLYAPESRSKESP